MSQNNSAGWLPAIGGGIVGAALTAGELLFAGPSLFGERLVRQALTARPEIIIDASDALRDKQYAEVLTPIRQQLELPFHSSWKGAEKPDVTLTYFFDYACGYCRVSNQDIERLLQEDKGLRVVYREFPILGPDSIAAARVSLAASKAGKFAEYHDALYAAGRPGPDTVAIAAKAAGVSPQPAEDPAQEAELRSNMMFASQLGLQPATPVFVVGNRVIQSAPGYEALKAAIETARQNG